AHGLQAKICCSCSWLHFLKGWSLLKTWCDSTGGVPGSRYESPHPGHTAEQWRATRWISVPASGHHIAAGSDCAEGSRPDLQQLVVDRQRVLEALQRHGAVRVSRQKNARVLLRQGQ